MLWSERVCIVVPGSPGTQLVHVSPHCKRQDVAFSSTWKWTISTALWAAPRHGRQLQVSADEPSNGEVLPHRLAPRRRFGFPTWLVPGLDPFHGYETLIASLREPFDGRTIEVISFPYDWRQSAILNAGRLAGFCSKVRAGRPTCSEVVLVCHSFGGIVAAMARRRAPDTAPTTRILTIATPWRGAVAAGASIVNGMAGVRKPEEMTKALRSMPSVAELAAFWPDSFSDAGWPQVLGDADCVTSRATGQARDHVAQVRGALRADDLLRIDDMMIIGTCRRTPVRAELPGRVLTVMERSDGDGTVPLVSSDPANLSHVPRMIVKRVDHDDLPDAVKVRLLARDFVHGAAIAPLASPVATGGQR